MPGVDSTEVPAEIISGDIALACCQGLIGGDSRVPGAAALAAAYDVPAATARAALGRLERGRLISPAGNGYAITARADDSERGTHLAFMAAARLCSRLCQPGMDQMAEAREMLLAAARRCSRGGMTRRDEAMAGQVRTILASGAGRPGGAAGRGDPLGKALAAETAWPARPAPGGPSRRPASSRSGGSRQAGLPAPRTRARGPQ